MSALYLNIFFAFLFAFLFTLYLIPLFIKIAYACNILDRPNGTVKNHKEPTPYLAGVAVYLGFLMSLGLVFPFDNQFFLFLVGSTILLYVGLIDDIIALRPGQKFTGQFIAVFCFLKAGFHLKAHIFTHMWSIPISALWMLSLINAFNLIDIMDGLAGTIALYSSIGFFIVALITQQYTAALLLAAFMGTLVAFLRFNLPPAKIYLGDAGALFIGGFLGIIPFLFNWGIFHAFGFLLPIIILALPLLEISALILIRTYKKIPFYYATPDHFAIYLKKRGNTPKQILCYVLFAASVPIIFSILFMQGLIGLPLLLGIGAIYFVLWTYCIYLR